MMMTRRGLFSAGAATAVSLTMPDRPLAAQARWQLATASQAESLAVRNLRQFIQEVRDASGDWMDLRLHAGGTLIKGAGLRRGVQAGQVQMAEMLLSSEADVDPVAELDVLPGLVRDYDQARRLTAMTRPLIERRLQRDGLTLLYQMTLPPSGLYTGFALDSLAALRGTRMRVRTPMGARMASLLGANPASLDPDEVEEAFATRVATTMFTSASSGLDMRAWTFSHFFIALDANFPRSTVVAQTRALEALPASARAALRDAATAAEARGWIMSITESVEAPKKLAKLGMELRQPSAAMAGELQRISATMLEEWLVRAGEPGQRLIKAYRLG
jgi:TRAP-type C4-dicarboxylate transport system substrate-binding protein